MNAAQKMDKARKALILDDRFYGSISLRLTPKPDPTVKKGWTDGQTIGYNPQFIDDCTLAEVKAFWGHEINHILGLDHLPTRRQGRDSTRWNIACDYRNNAMLQQEGFTLPQGVLMPEPHMEGRAPEAIYNMLPGDEPQEQPEPDDTEEPDDSQQPDPEGDDEQPDPEGEGDSSDGDGQEGDGDGQPEQSTGEGTNGQQQPSGISYDGDFGEVRDAPGSLGDWKQEEADLKLAVTQATQTMGDAPAGLKRIVEDLIDPDLPIEEYLRRFVETHARNDYSTLPPNRRFIHMGLYLPSLRSQELPPVILGVDTSGSVTDQMIANFGGIMTRVLEAFDSILHVLYTDAAVQTVQTLTREDLPLQLDPKGGGGTDFRPVFQWVEEQDEIEPACLIYFTDLYGTFPDEEPEYPVLWVTTSDKTDAPFGEVVKMQEY